MYKRFLPIIAVICFLNLFNNYVYAQEETVSMSEWKFIQIDSNDDYTICKYYSKNDANKYGFCLQANEHFNKLEKYNKHTYNDDYVFEIVRAYELYGKDLDESNQTEKYNYFCACQILIWEHLIGEEIEFEKDYSSYKQDILNYMHNYVVQTISSPLNNQEYEIEIGEELTINGNFSQYDIQKNDDIEVINKDDNSLTIKVINDQIDNTNIQLITIYNPKDYAYIYSHEKWQDIYSFEGTYEIPETINIKLTIHAIEPTYTDIFYSKKDLDGNNIAGAKFNLYELNNDDYNDDILFIHKDVPINLYEAILNDYSTYKNLSIELSERYETYLNGGVIEANEVGSFPYKIYNDDICLKQGICYVSDDINQTNGTYKMEKIKDIALVFSDDVDINTISHVETKKVYYLCESEPAKGYTYVHNACKLIDTNTYQNEIIDFVNDSRTYTLKLMKQSPYNVFLNGAKFKISYLDNNDIKDIYLTTGYLNIQRQNNYQYLFYRHVDDDIVTTIEFNDDYYCTNNVKEGKYYYYQSNDNNIDYSLLNDEYTYVFKGGFNIIDLPYSSSLTIEELEAPSGYMITDPIYYLEPNITYNEVTFRNYRVNEFEILPKKKIKIVKTCVDE